MELYEKASFADVNWIKCEGPLLKGYKEPTLPEGLQCNRDGMKCLGVFLGRDEFQKKNWQKRSVPDCPDGAGSSRSCPAWEEFWLLTTWPPLCSGTILLLWNLQMH